MRRALIDESGQMSVELVVCLPVILVVLFVAIHGMIFAAACARFDELAPQFVRVEATGDIDELSICNAITVDLEEAFKTYPGISITVTSEWVDGITGNLLDEESITFFIMPHHTKYVVELSYYPRGLPSSVFGVEIKGATHEQAFVVDSYKPGMWM
jgi:hypothetical protein